VDLFDILSLKSLEHLSIDMDELSDEIVLGLIDHGRSPLRTLSINIRRYEGFPKIRPRTWQAVEKR